MPDLLFSMLLLISFLPITSFLIFSAVPAPESPEVPGIALLFFRFISPLPLSPVVLPLVGMVREMSWTLLLNILLMLFLPSCCDTCWCDRSNVPWRLLLLVARP